MSDENKILKLIEQWAAAYGLPGSVVLVLIALGAFLWYWPKIKERPPFAWFFKWLWRRELIKQAQRCLNLLTQIKDANERVIHRGKTVGGPWAEILNDKYNHVCEMREGKASRAPYFDAICDEPDVGIVCDKKWELGEAVVAYRDRLSLYRSSFLPPSLPDHHYLDHHDLEVKICQSVTDQDFKPVKLQMGVEGAIEAAKCVLAESGRSRP